MTSLGAKMFRRPGKRNKQRLGRWLLGERLLYAKKLSFWENRKIETICIRI